MIWSYIYYIPLSRDKHTDFNQCCWLFCIVSTRVPPALTQASAIALVLPCNSFGHRQANWRWFCEKHMYQQSLGESRENPWSFWCFSGPCKGKLGLIYLCCITHDLWILRTVPWSLGAFFTPAVTVLGWWSCCSDHWLLGFLSSDLKSHLFSCSTGEICFVFCFLCEEALHIKKGIKNYTIFILFCDLRSVL